MSTKLTLGFSPCPNDTFIFDALVNGKIDTGGLAFDVMLEDVQTLNQWAMEEKLDISKISYGVLPLVSDTYNLLQSGGALGMGVGPLLVAKKIIEDHTLKTATIAIPGENTTAHVLFSLAFPEARRKQFMVFSDIEEAVMSGAVDAGVIIHEGRFTYAQKGLVKLQDLGTFWEEATGCPIPLGGIVVRKNIPSDIQGKLSGLIRKSVEYAFANYPDLPDYVRNNSQEMQETVMRQHIDLYVNDYSRSLGTAGRQAVNTFLEVYADMNQSHAPVVSLVG
jgi:1,4-dihydroxy-6-naphthoate synthase